MLARRFVTLLGYHPYTFTNSEAATYVAAMSVAPTYARKLAIDTFIGSLKSASVWTRLDALYLLAAHDSAAALINVKTPGTFNATAVNSPAFTVDRGYTGNGTSSYLSTGFVPSTAGGGFVQDDAAFGVWSRTDAQSATGSAGGSNEASNTQNIRLDLRSATDTATGRINQDITATTSAANTNSSGHFVLRRTSSTAVNIRRNAASFATFSKASVSLNAKAIYLLAMNSNGSAAAFCAYEFAAAHIGASLSDQNVTDLYAALGVYMTAVGAA